MKNIELIIEKEKHKIGTPAWIQARNNLALNNLKLVDYTIRQVLKLSNTHNLEQTLEHYNIEYEDLTQSGYIGLVEASSKATSQYAKAFPRYATLHIKKHIIKHFHNHRISFKLSETKGNLAGKMRKAIVVYEQTGQPVTLENMKTQFSPEYSNQNIEEIWEMIIATRGETQAYPPEYANDFVGVPESTIGLGVEELLQTMTIESLHKALDTLPRPEKWLLKYRFGFTTGKPESYASTETHYKMSNTQVRQMEALAFAKLLHPTRLVKMFIDD